MDITIRQAELFLALVRTERVQSVAKEFFLTQSAVSTAIRRFEESVGVPLFDRAHKKITANSNGKTLAEELAPLVTQFQNVTSMFQKDYISGRLEIGASQTLADYLLPQVLYGFQVRHPKAQLSIWSGNSREVVHAVELGEVPVGFIEGEVPSRMLESTLMGSEELVVVSSDKEFAGAKSYTMDELLHYRWILRESGSGTREAFIHQLLEKAQKLNIFMELDHIESIKHVLRNPGTLSCLSQHSIIHELARGALYPVQVEDSFTRNLYQVIHPRQSSTLLMEAVSADISEAIVTASRSLTAL
ncbi:LysR substrate-binding domain-containing protein [Desulforhopalus singaporensis]|uniref:DNA-binding transcriptional regulator, LysR family n=1 Tax=Desulforhopalus singaporensis TaxID=91360 RepID=A0A1H0N900_9BACT|nr:LysR substrate-binding domain-containing protein [Desulforhopalus singaporensis]SDO89172.1 DNA-binding transcriptional regulator, LysR family [Desulforhopalus singaporensis]